MKRFYRLMSVALMMGVASTGLVNYASAGRDDVSRSEKSANFAKFLESRRMAGKKLGGGGTAGFDLNDLKEKPAPVFRSNSENPKGNVYGVIPTYRSASGYTDALYAKINLSNGRVSKVYQNPVYTIGEDYQFQGAVERKGILYIPTYGVDMVSSEFSFAWRRVELATGKVLEPIDFGGEFDSFCYSLAYDSTKDKIYGLSIDVASGMMGNLIEIDPLTWKLDYITNVGAANGDCMCNIAYNPSDGLLYGMKDNGKLYEINTNNGRTSVVKEFDDWDDYFIFPETQSPQAFVYDPVDHCFVTIFRDAQNEVMRIAYIDCSNGEYEAVLGQDLNDIYYVASLICPDQYADDEAPAIPKLGKITFKDAELDGTVTFTAPTLTYNDLAINGTLNARILVDDNNVYSATVKPGEEVTVPVTVKQGLHTLEVICTLDGKDSPKAVSTFYAGYDNPKAPTGLNLDGNVLTWRPVSGTGEHDGYVTADGMAYTVYIDGESQGRPRAECSYTIPEFNEMKRCEITVVASSNGLSSKPSEALSEVIGKAKELPLTLKPTKAESELFTIVDANSDGCSFRFMSKNGEDYMGIQTDPYYVRADDWLVLPKLSFKDTQTQYNLSFRFSNVFGNDKHYDSMIITLCKKRDIDSIEEGTVIYSHIDKQNPEHKLLSVNFVVPEAGDYYLAIHSMGGQTSGQYRGIKVSDISVNSLKGTSVKAPAEPKVTMKAADKGDLRAVATIVAPTQDLAGNALTSTVKFDAVCGEHKASASCKPGEECTMTVEVDKDGFSDVVITPSNEFGNGIPKTYSCYVGIDVPTAPTNIQGVPSDDNMQLFLTWNAPTEGVNGGYLDPATMSYDIYTHPSTASYQKIGNTKELKYTYQAPETQAPTFVGPVAVNELGQSKYSVFVYEFLGRPLELPFKELFSSKATGFPLWKFSTDTKYENVGWDVTGYLDFLGYGSVPVTEGVLAGHNTAESDAPGRLFGPKFSTKGINKAAFVLKYFNYPDAARMTVMGRSSKHHDLIKIAECVPTGGRGNWAEFRGELTSDLLDCGWVQLYIDVVIGPSSKNSYFIMDSFEVVPDYDYDFKVSSLTGTDYCSVGDNANYKVEIMNSGLEAATATLTMEVLGDGKRLDSKDYKIGRTLPGNTFVQKVSMPVLVEYLGYDKLEVKATVKAEKDEIPSNNSRTTDLNIKDNILPIVESLKAEWTDENHNAAVLSWEKPDCKFGDYDSFEYLPTFKRKDRIGMWKNHDGDMREQFVFSLSNMRWDGDDEPSAWTVYDPAVLGLSEEPRLTPHSGKQMIMARSVAYDYTTEEPIQNQDWLISPKVVGGTKVSFWMNTLDTQYSETIDIWVSTGGDTPGEIPYMAKKGDVAGDFYKLRAFTKSGTDSWEKIEFTLPENAKYFALVYASIGQFGVCVDDIEFTPAEMKEMKIDSYKVYRTIDGNTEKIADDLTAMSYSDTNLSDTSVRYNVTAVVEREGESYEGPLSNGAYIWQTGVGEIKADGTIVGGKGLIGFKGHAGDKAAIYSTDGRLLRVADIDGEYSTVSCEPGVYIVKAGKSVAKVLVK